MQTAEWMAFTNKLEPGDIVLFKTNTTYGKLVRAFTGERWNHVALVSSVGATIEFVETEFSTGVRINSDIISDYFKPGIQAVSYRLKKRPAPTIVRTVLADFIAEVKGRKYDMLQILSLAVLSRIGLWTFYSKLKPLSTGGAMTCADLVYNFYIKLGVDLFPGIECGNKATPSMFAGSHLLTPVARLGL